MKKLVLALCVVLAMSGVVAEEKRLTPDEIKKMPIEERKAYSDRMRYQRTGGDIVRPGTIAGEVSVVDCRVNSDSSDLFSVIGELRKCTRIAIAVKKGAFELANPKTESGMTLFVVDDDKLPLSLQAPESRWAVMNVRRLHEGRGAEPAFFKARTEKMFARTFSALCGAASSNYRLPITGGVFKVEDLDGIVSTQLPPDVVSRYAAYLAPAGVVPGEFVSYRRACTEGWAPAPTNEVQKVIWEQIKAEANEKPTNPIKITKEKK